MIHPRPRYFAAVLAYANAAHTICIACGSARDRRHACQAYEPTYTSPPPGGIMCHQCGEWISPPYCPDCGEAPYQCQCPTQAKEEAA